MFKKNKSQTSLFQPSLVMSIKLKKMLKNSWAQILRDECIPTIDEDKFAHLYCKDDGRPNFPVAIMIGLSIIKELLDLTDTLLIHSFHFDILVLHALGLGVGELCLAPRTLYYFRDRVASDPAVLEIFEGVTAVLLKKLDICTDVQRIDSTQVSSNMANLSRLGLFVRTIEMFLHELFKIHPELAGSKVPADIRDRYLDRSGYFSDATAKESRRRLEQAAQDLALLIKQFEGCEEIESMKSYKLLLRLFSEQCRVETAQDDQVAVLKDPKEIASDSLQNPSDPDATYSAHKGKGYQVQIAETCDSKNPVQLITYVAVEGAHKSDHNALMPYIEDTEERGVAPKEVFADTNYCSGPNLVNAAVEGVNLISPTPGKVDPDDLTLANFEIDFKTLEVSHCPEKEKPCDQKPSLKGDAMNAHFDKERCRACELADICPAGKNGGRIRFTLEDLALAFGRAREETTEFKEAYKIRSGIESTNAELKKAHGLGRVWTRGKERVTFAVIMKALAVNIKRYARARLAQISENAPESGSELDSAASLGSLRRTLRQLIALPTNFLRTTFAYGFSLCVSVAYDGLCSA